MSNQAQARRLANALGQITGEGEIREVMSDNEAMVKSIRIIVLAAALVLLSAVGGCTYFNATEQAARKAALDKGMVKAVTIDGAVYIQPECAGGVVTYRGSNRP